MPQNERELKRILVSQPAPADEDSPYMHMAKRLKVEVDFFPFIRIEPTSVQDFRNQKLQISEHSAIIFTSRNAIDHFFGLCKACRQEIPDDMKYFCITDQTAYYLQKYIVVRKRKVYTGSRTAADLIALIKRHKKERYLFPCADVRKQDIPDFLQAQDITFRELVIYHTCANEMNNLPRPITDYDLIAFFSPSGVRALVENFPDFNQYGIRLAAFGPTTARSVREHGLHLDIEAPLPKVPSMTAAIERYAQQHLSATEAEDKAD